jgi:hypothetical protein
MGSDEWRSLAGPFPHLPRAAGTLCWLHPVCCFLPVAPTNLLLQDSDDDGEQAAGSRLLHLLQVTDSRNVCVVVSRWFGGIHLGPARFTHINNAARELLDACGYIAARDNANRGSSGKGKKR